MYITSKEPRHRYAKLQSCPTNKLDHESLIDLPDDKYSPRYQTFTFATLPKEMEFDANRLSLSTVRCLHTSGVFYEGHLAGMDSVCNAALQQARVTTAPSSSANAVVLEEADSMWLKGSNVVYIGFTNEK